MQHKLITSLFLLLAVTAAAQDRTADPNPEFKVRVNTTQIGRAHV